MIAGCIEAGAIGADEIASDTIVARHMVVGNFGAVNDDPDCKDATAWVTVDSQWVVYDPDHFRWQGGEHRHS